MQGDIGGVRLLDLILQTEEKDMTNEKMKMENENMSEELSKEELGNVSGGANKIFYPKRFLEDTKNNAPGGTNGNTGGASSTFKPKHF